MKGNFGMHHDLESGPPVSTAAHEANEFLTARRLAIRPKESGLVEASARTASRTLSIHRPLACEVA